MYHTKSAKVKQKLLIVKIMEVKDTIATEMPFGWQPMLGAMELKQKHTFQNTRDDKPVKRARRAIKTFYANEDNPPYRFKTRVQRFRGTFTITRDK